MNPEFYITDEQIAKARENGACAPALEWAQKERDWRKIPPDWLEWDAENTKLCPVEVLVNRSENEFVRRSFARHPNTPVKVLIEFSNDSDWGVRYWAAQNANIPTEVLIKLSKDSNSNVRYSVARNPSTPVEALIELSKDSDWGVCYWAGENLNTPKD